MTGRTAATWLSRGEIGVSGVFLRSRGRQPAIGPYPDGTLQDGISQMPLVAKSGSAFLWVGETLVVRLCLFLTLSGESSHRTPQRASSQAFPHEWRTCLGNRTKVGRCKPESIFFPPPLSVIFWTFHVLFFTCLLPCRNPYSCWFWVESQVRMKLDRQVTETNILLSWGLNPNSAWIRDCLLSKDCFGLWQSS